MGEMAKVVGQMARYIDADKFHEWVYPNWSYCAQNDDDFHEAIDAQPTADVAPVIHAHWEYRYDTGIYQTEFLCSRCKGLIETYSCTVDEVEYEYCPHCGAKMDEKEEG